MAATGQSITAIEDIPAAGEVANVVKDKPGITLKRRSMVQIFLTRGGAAVLATVTVGGSNVFPQGPVNLVVAVGTIPSTQDDQIIEVIAQPGDTIIIAATNTSAGPLEIRALIKIMPIA